jgi:hypothetical protein
MPIRLRYRQVLVNCRLRLIQSKLSRLAVPTDPAAIRQMPPIVGWDGASTRFVGATARLPFGEPSQVADGLHFGIDLQPDGPSSAKVFETVAGLGPGKLRFELTADRLGSRLRLELVDDDGRRLIAEAPASRSAGKRVICRIVPKQDAVRFYEIQPWASTSSLQVTYLAQEGPRTFDQFPSEFELAGAGGF